jgi:dienelactone hydrolase
MRKSRVTRPLIGGLLATALVAAGLLTTTPAALSAATRTRTTGALARLTLPAPTGPDTIGTAAVRLVDHSRPDPWVAAQPYRELMVSVFYPARDTGASPLAPQMTPAAAKHFDESLGAPVHEGWGIPPGKVDWGATLTHAHLNAPAAAGRHPVVLYSPGLGDPRTLGTTLVEDLASRGYVVVTVDHTYDASEVEFPGGRVEPFTVPTDGDILATLKKLVSVRVADTRFVLDQLPSALPNGLSDALDLGRIGMLGQSAGGFTALQTMHDDPRVLAAANLDGTVGFDQEDGGPGLSPLAEDGLKRPFLLMGGQPNDHHTVRSWEALWSNSTGWKRDLHLRGAAHHTYTDMESLVPQLTGKIGLPAETVRADVGWVDPAHAVTDERAYLASFFDRWLRGRDDGLLDGPSPRHPDVTFVR